MSGGVVKTKDYGLPCWVAVFTDPEDLDWTIQTDGRGRYIMNHNCKEDNWKGGAPGALMYVGACCIGCGAKYNKEFKGFLKLVRYGAENG